MVLGGTNCPQTPEGRRLFFGGFAYRSREREMTMRWTSEVPS